MSGDDFGNFYEGLKRFIRNAEEALPEGQQMNVYYYDRVGNQILVNGIGYDDPLLIILHGQDAQENQCIVLVQTQPFELTLKASAVAGDAKPEKLIFFGKTKDNDFNLKWLPIRRAF